MHRVTFKCESHKQKKAMLQEFMAGICLQDLVYPGFPNYVLSSSFLPVTWYWIIVSQTKMEYKSLQAGLQQLPKRLYELPEKMHEVKNVGRYFPSHALNSLTRFRLTMISFSAEGAR